jgi:hypothetical protein
MRGLVTDEREMNEDMLREELVMRACFTFCCFSSSFSSSCLLHQSQMR